MSASSSGWDTSYEWKAVLLLCLGFGLVGLDRFMILPMFPTLMKELNLSYQDLGYITGILSVAWGIAGFFMGRLSDRIGRRKVVVGAILVFSVLVGVSGLATGLASLLVIRAIMGLADGAYTPPSIIATIEASEPSRHGRNLGIQQMAAPLFGLGLAPIFVTQMLQIVDWRWIFALVTPPGLVVSYLLYWTLRTPSAEADAVHTATHDTRDHAWTDVFRYRNILLNMGGMLCWLTCLIVTSAMLPSYLTDYLHLSLPQMGFVLSAIGFGATAGTALMPWLSDRLGRKTVVTGSALATLVLLVLFTRLGADPATLFAVLFAVHFFNFAAITLTVGPISAESVPVKLMATASGAVIGVGEIFGGGIAPAIAGTVAGRFGIQYTLYLAIVAMAFGVLVGLGLRETAPAVLRRRGTVPATATGGAAL